jgi:hypothetical protein
MKQLCLHINYHLGCLTLNLESFIFILGFKFDGPFAILQKLYLMTSGERYYNFFKFEVLIIL